MEIAFADWLNLILRWLHLIAGIAWIGSSFYFIWLDLSLDRRAGSPSGVYGESWNVHGGGFYLMQKYTVAPERMPETLHWFKWEAYFTWMSGIALLGVMYYWGAESYLIDRDVAALAPWQAIAISVATLAAGWIVYDRLCKSPLGKKALLLSAVVFVLISGSAFLLTQVFSGRGAFVHVGAMVGTIMTANVFFVIIPNQKIVVADLIAGRAPDARLGIDAKQRSTHNNYLTLPVLLMMVSAHYPMIFGHAQSWLVVALILLVGGIVRHFFNSRNAGGSGAAVAWQWPAATLLMVALIVFVSYRPGGAVQEADIPDANDVLAVVQARCVACHAARPSDPDFDEAPGGVRLETLADLKRDSARILKQAVLTKAMPLGNKTGMTKPEREAVGLWIRAGMPEGD